MGMDHGIGKIAKLSRVSKPSFSSRISLHRCEHIYIYIYGICNKNNTKKGSMILQHSREL
jgi:hypothetical protein